MKSLAAKIEELKKSPIRDLVNSRIVEFASRKSGEELFNELCFCLLTANFNAERAIAIQGKIGNFRDYSLRFLAKRLKELGHRYPNARADYIFEAGRHYNSLAYAEKEHDFREWLVRNVRGLGYKESSHFLRNIGYLDCAIIDFHIIDLLVKHKMIQRPKILNRARYLEIESKLREVSEKANLNLAQLDLYLWYLETGKVLK